MATIDELERQILELKRELDISLEKTNQLQRESQKALDMALHTYKTDEYGCLWVYDAKEKTYRKTKMRVMTPEIADKAIKAIHIAPNAVTGDKMQDEIIIPGKIANDAVSTRNIQNKAVTLQKLAADVLSKFSTVEKTNEIAQECNAALQGLRKLRVLIDTKTNDLQRQLTESTGDLQNQIDSLEIAGVALSNEFGENKNIGISQWALSHWARTIQQKIDELTGENSHGMYMTISRDYVVGDTGTIHITASSEGLTGIFDHITLYANNQIILEQSAVGFVHYNLEITETTIITCVAKIMGENFVESKTVSYFPKAFYLGGGDSYLDVFNQAHLVPVNGDSQRGSYDIHLNQGDHIIILLDNSLDEEFIAAYMDGFEIPFTSEDVTIDGDNYHFLLSKNIYAEDTYNIDIVVNSETPNTDNNE